MPVSQKPRAILIDVIPSTMEPLQAKRRLMELESLTRTYGGIVVVKLLQKRALPNYRTYIGKGKLEEIIQIAKEEHVELLIINNLLKASQMYAVGELLRPHHMRAWDRIDLILNIFAKNAKTAEAQLQIKLAAIHHMGPRIYGMGQEMMRQAGGTGTRGGQGETNTELMKRHFAQQERRLKRELESLTKSRANHRRRRMRIGLKTVSIVGYTNAGKSSLLRALTRKKVHVADTLFATLDTRVGKLWLPNMQTSVLLSDTIGFIQDLPPQLIDAFRSTLDETVSADLLLHVIDVSDPFMAEKIREVEEVLDVLQVSDTPKIYVFNKIDLAPKFKRGTLSKRYAPYTPVFVSAENKAGLDELIDQISKRLP